MFRLLLAVKEYLFPPRPTSLYVHMDSLLLQCYNASCECVNGLSNHHACLVLDFFDLIAEFTTIVSDLPIGLCLLWRLTETCQPQYKPMGKSRVSKIFFIKSAIDQNISKLVL